MKHTSIILLAIIMSIAIALIPYTTYAQEESAETESQTDAIKDKINDLKERLATKVAELKEQNKRAFYGVIKELDESSMTLLYRDEEIPVVFDDETSFSEIDIEQDITDGDRDSFELGETATVFGTLDLDNKTVVAASLYKQELPLINHGIVQSVDTDEGTFAIESSTGNITLDYEISTICTWMVDDELTRCGLSRITEGDRVFLRIEADEEEISRATVLRMLLVPQDATASPTASEEAPANEQ